MSRPAFFHFNFNTSSSAFFTNNPSPPMVTMRIPLLTFLIILSTVSLAASFTASVLNLFRVRSHQEHLSKKPKNPPPASFQHPLYLQTTNEDEDDAAFMTALRNRIDETTRMPLVVLDCMLPRQELNITVQNPGLLRLLQDRMIHETPVFCMLGMARLVSGQGVHLKYGVAVEIVDCIVTEESRVAVHLRAGDLLRVRDDTVTTVHSWTEAQVDVLDPTESERRMDPSLGLAQAMWKARKLESLVQEWIPLAKTKERIPNQLEMILERLGDMPDAEHPSDRAFWVGALINPIPALGVANEIRPALLVAKTPMERIEIVTNGLQQSIARLKQAV